MIAEKFLNSESVNIEQEIKDFRKEVLESLNKNGINDCTILTKKLEDKIHVIAISCITKENTTDNKYQNQGFEFVKNDLLNSQKPSIEPNSISFNFKKPK